MVISTFARASLLFCMCIAAPVISTPAHAAGGQRVGMLSTCVVQTGGNYLECDFQQLPANLEIDYVSGHCSVPAGGNGVVWEFQIFVTPPSSSTELPYQIPVTQQSLIGSPSPVWGAGSPVKLFAKASSKPRALLNMGAYAANTGLACTVSLSGETF
jgi:hypothetical protein